MKPKYLLYIGIIGVLTVQMVGCIAAAAAYPALVVGSIAKNELDSIEKATINAAVSPGITTEQLSRIKRVSFLLSGEGQMQDLLNSGGFSGIMSDNLSLELMKQGFECVDHQKLKKTLEEQGNELSGPIDLNNAIKAGNLIGVQAIITGSVKASASYGAGGLLSTKVTASTKIQSVSLKIIGVESGDTMMVVAINYKHGKTPDAAAKSMARIIKAKLENPFTEKGKKKKNS